jgi:hypothetical protein
MAQQVYLPQAEIHFRRNIGAFRGILDLQRFLKAGLGRSQEFEID